MHEKTRRLLESSTHPLDQYPWDGNAPPPLSERNVRQFQERINAICGLVHNGRPAVRVIWPADPDESVSMRTDEDGEKRARYALYSEEYQCERVTESGLTIVDLVTVDIVTQRWMLEEYNEQANTYIHLRTIGHHDERCCDGAESIGGHLCFGLYREPEQRDLDDLQRMVKEREAWYRVRQDEPMSYGEMQSYLSRIRTWREQADAAVRGKYKDAILSGLLPQAPRLLSDDPSVHSHGKYHFLKGAT